jgi:hypothetical protein
MLKYGMRPTKWLADPRIPRAYQEQAIREDVSVTYISLRGYIGAWTEENTVNIPMGLNRKRMCLDEAKSVTGPPPYLPLSSQEAYHPCCDASANKHSAGAQTVQPQPAGLEHKLHGKQCACYRGVKGGRHTCCCSCCQKHSLPPSTEVFRRYHKSLEASVGSMQLRPYKNLALLYVTYKLSLDALAYFDMDTDSSTITGCLLLVQR